jgi:hypothetical protein
MAKSITVGKRENEKKRLAKREEKQKKMQKSGRAVCTTTKTAHA